MHTIHSCQNTSCPYLGTNPTPCKPSQLPQTHSFQPLSDSFNLSINTAYNIPNGASQHRRSTASYFVINLFFLIMILFRKEQQRFHFVFNPINIINVLTLYVGQGFLFEILFSEKEKKKKKSDWLWRLAILFSDPQLIPDVKLLLHKIMTSCQ